MVPVAAFWRVVLRLVIAEGALNDRGLASSDLPGDGADRYRSALLPAGASVLLWLPGSPARRVRCSLASGFSMPAINRSLETRLATPRSYRPRREDKASD